MKRLSAEMLADAGLEQSTGVARTRKIRKRGGPSLVLSAEQEEVVALFANEQNVLNIAKAGGGKTTLALHAAFRFHRRQGERCMIITYNTRLKKETRERIEREGLKKAVECHSYHAAAFKFLAPDHTQGADDSLIRAALDREPPAPLEFGAIIIDEGQDMNPLYARFIVKLLQSCARPPVMLIVGDPFQRIFGFNGATTDYLSHPEKYFGQYTRNQTFHVRHLSICWRITHEMAQFVNESLNPCNLAKSHPEWWKEHGDRITAWWGTGIHANPQRPTAPNSVEVIRGWGSKHAVSKCRQMFKKYGNDEVALLSYSLKNSRSPIHALVDKLGKKDTENWLILQGNGKAVTSETVKNKRVASTVHRFKGLERKGILVCGVDSFIERIMKTDPLDHFNVWYVACTRATDKLIINVTGADYATIRCSPQYKNMQFKTECSLEKLVEYVPFDEVLSVQAQLFQTAVEVDLEKTVEMTEDDYLVVGREAGTMEDLSPFLERAISFMLMIRIHHTLNSLPQIYKNSKFDPDMFAFVRQFMALPMAEITWPLLIKYAVAYETFKSKYKHYWRQLKEACAAYNRPELLNRCTQNAFDVLWAYAVAQKAVSETVVNPTEQEEALQKLVVFETPLSISFRPAWFKSAFHPLLPGTIDILFNNRVVIGLSCSTDLTMEKCLHTQLCQSVLNLRRDEEKGCDPFVLLTNSSRLVQLHMLLRPTLPQVPLNFELVHRAAKRKLHLGDTMPQELLRDWEEWENKK